ncbi:MAG: Y-family DNA polymerase [Rickettsiales bacterium]
MNQESTIERPNRWLYIDFNSYFASVEQQLNSALRGRPVAVVPVMTDATSAIAASYEAKAYGIKTGTPVWEAKAKCPGLICVLGNHEAYVEYHHRAIAEIENHIPVTMVCSIDEIACRLLSNENSLKRSTEIAMSIKRGLAKNVGEFVKCSIGIAPNRYLAKVARDMQKPDGLTFLNTSDLPHKLYSLELRDLPGIGRNMEKRINTLGIWSVEALCALDARQMRHLWGSIWGERMWYYLRGVELPDEETTRGSVGHSHVMAPELRHPDKARYVTRRLTLKATSRLRRLGYDAKTISLSMRLEDGRRFISEMHCMAASDSLIFLHMLEQMWSTIIGQTGRGFRIKKVSVTFYRLTLSGTAQPDLFAPISAEQIAERDRAMRMSKALDTLNQRYGRDTVALGMLPKDGRSFSGTKIAFTRIPDSEEFLE